DTYRFDYSYALGAFAGSRFPGYDGVRAVEPVRTDRFTQELRLLVPLGPDVDWLFGVFYAHESNPSQESVDAINTSSGEQPAGGGLVAFLETPTRFREYAGFTNLTWRITSKLDVQMGLRESEDKLEGTYTVDGPLFGGSIASLYSARSADRAFTYAFTP